MNGISTTQTAPGVSALARIIRTYNRSMESSLERIASGLRVNRPSDDISTYFRAQDLNQLAESSATTASGLQEHISRLSTAEDALKTIDEILQQMADKAKEASTETDANTRESLGYEYDAMKDSITTIVNTTRFKGDLILNGTFDPSAQVSAKVGAAIKAQVGEDPTDIFSYQILDTRVDKDIAGSIHGLNLTNGSVAASWKAGTAGALASYQELTESDAGDSRIQRNLSRISTNLTVLSGARTNLENKQSNYQAASSALVGVDQAEESSRYASLQIQQQAAASFLAQSNINYGNVIGVLTGFTSRR